MKIIQGLKGNASVLACRSRVRDKIVLARSRENVGRKFLRCMLVSLLVRRSRVIVLARSREVKNTKGRNFMARKDCNLYKIEPERMQVNKEMHTNQKAVNTIQYNTQI